MGISEARRRSVEACAADAGNAMWEHDDAIEWFTEHGDSLEAPLAAEAWVFDPTLSMVLLVDHPWRRWVPPGGKIEDGETPCEAAVREAEEETGLRIQLHSRPAAVAVRSFHPDWPATLSLSYYAIADGDVRLTPEDGQPATWMPLNDAWPSSFPDDRDRMLDLVRLLADLRSSNKWQPH